MKTLGILIFPEFETLDVFGPLEMFGCLPEHIKIVLIAQHDGLIKSTHGQSLLADFSINNALPLDYLLIPGGPGTRTEVNNQALIQWIKECHPNTELTLSVCTGAALLAKAGILDGHRATSNKLAFDWVMEQGPNVEWIKKARWVDDGKIITSSGVSAGIDMSLYVITRLFGDDTCNQVTQKTEYIFNKNATNDPFSVN